jgi:hypothetical protein
MQEKGKLLVYVPETHTNTYPRKIFQNIKNLSLFKPTNKNMTL